MRKRTLQRLVILLTMVSLNASALDTTNLLAHTDASALLAKHCIRTEIGGFLPIRFDVAIDHLKQPHLIEHILQEYRRSVSRNGAMDFPVASAGNGRYCYVNESNQRTDIHELCRKQTSDTIFDLVYYANGKRYFGSYEVLIHVRVIDAGPVGTAYVASIHAYPHNGPLRFLVRRLGVVERYFKRKTRLIAGVSNRICRSMGENKPFVYSPAMQNKPEAGPTRM